MENHCQREALRHDNRLAKRRSRQRQQLRKPIAFEGKKAPDDSCSHIRSSNTTEETQNKSQIAIAYEEISDLYDVSLEQSPGALDGSYEASHSDVANVQWHQNQISHDALIEHTPASTDSIIDTTSFLPWQAIPNYSCPDPLLHKAVARGHIDVVRTLLENGARIDATDRFGAPALLVAARCRDVAMMELLLQNHADPNCADAIGTTPLEVAVELADNTLVVLLLRMGARIV